MNDKKVDQRLRQKEIEERKQLESMIEDAPDSLELISEDAISAIKKKKELRLDYDLIKSEIDIESDQIVFTSAEFYFEKSEIKSEPYLMQKINVFKLTVSNLLFQMKTAEHAIVKLLEKIDDGAGVDRTFEVLAALQKSKMEIVKHLSAFMVVMENSLKETRNDLLQKIAEGRSKQNQLEISESSVIEDGTIENTGDNITVRGTKALINSIREVADSQLFNKKEFESYGKGMDD